MTNKSEYGLKNTGNEPPLKSALLEGINHAHQKEIARLLKIIEGSGLIIHQEPRLGLIMMTVKDSFDTPFHLGEVLVTTAEVEHDGQRGYGVLLGDEPEKALLLASVEAIELRGDRELIGCLKGLIGPLREKAEAERLRLMKLAGSTQVSFDSMTQE